MYQSDETLVTRLDKSEYNEEDLVLISIPINLPYYSSQNQFERLDGELTHNGIYYSYVKRKVTNDTLYILCLPNDTKSKLQDAQTDYARHSNDLPSGKHQPNGKKISAFSEHNSQFAAISFEYINQDESPVFYSFSSPLCSRFLQTSFQPPDIPA